MTHGPFRVEPSRAFRTVERAAPREQGDQLAAASSVASPAAILAPTRVPGRAGSKQLEHGKRRLALAQVAGGGFSQNRRIAGEIGRCMRSATAKRDVEYRYSALATSVARTILDFHRRSGDSGKPTPATCAKARRPLPVLELLRTGPAGDASWCQDRRGRRDGRTQAASLVALLPRVRPRSTVSEALREASTRNGPCVISTLPRRPGRRALIGDRISSSREPLAQARSTRSRVGHRKYREI